MSQPKVRGRLAAVKKTRSHSNALLIFFNHPPKKHFHENNSIQLLIGIPV